jgi:hypothetical protein
MSVKEFSISQALICLHPSLDRFFADIKGVNVALENAFSFFICIWEAESLLK